MSDQHAPARIVAREEAEVLGRLRAGDATAAEALYRATLPATQRYARRFTVPGHDPDDLAAEAYARMLAALTAGKGPTVSATAYLRATIRNLAWSHSRRGRQLVELLCESVDQHPVVCPQPTGEDLLLTAERLDDIRRAWLQLRPRWRRVLVLTAVEGATSTDAAEQLGMTSQAVRALVCRARAALRASLFVETAAGA